MAGFFILLMLIVVLWFLCFATKLNNFTSPTYLLVLGFFLSTVVGIIGNFRWKVDLNLLVPILIFFSLFSFFCGELFGRGLVRRSLRINSLYNRENQAVIYSPNKYTLLFILGVCVVFLMLYVKEQVNLAKRFGYSGTLFFKYVRAGFYTGEIANSTFVNIIKMFIEIIAYYCLYVFVTNRALNTPYKASSSVLLLGPFLCYLIMQVFTGARSGFIEIIVHLLIFVVLILSKSSGINKKKLVKYSIFAVLLYLVIFSLLGILTEKTNKDNFLEKIYIYVGSAIPAFSKFMDNLSKNIVDNNHETFTGLFNLLQSLQGKQVSITAFSLPYVSFANGSLTNIYTAFRSYYHDYGVMGMILIQLISGIVFGYWIAHILKYPAVPAAASATLYAHYLFRLLIELFTPSLTSTLFTVGETSRVIFCIIFQFLFFRTNFLFRKKIVTRKC